MNQFGRVVAPLGDPSKSIEIGLLRFKHPRLKANLPGSAWNVTVGSLHYGCVGKLKMKLSLSGGYRTVADMEAAVRRLLFVQGARSRYDGAESVVLLGKPMVAGGAVGAQTLRY